MPTDTDLDGTCDAIDTDDDGDGVTDALDSAPLNPNVCRDADGDGCDDCSSGTDAPNNDGTDTDSDGLCDSGDLDDDNDTWSDTDEAACGTNPLDSGSVPTDTDLDGTCDAIDTDDDGDGVTDALDSAPLNPNVCRDVDADGCDDCSTGTDDPANDGTDSDGDGICDLGDACPGFDDAIDCNANGVPDGCDISAGTSVDSNTNGIPDECEGTPFVRSDANGDGNIDISDPITTLGFLFTGQTTLCLVALDANDSEEVNIADVIFSLSSLFGAGAQPNAPFPTCGLDPTPGPLDCTSFPSCL